MSNASTAPHSHRSSHWIPAADWIGGYELKGLPNDCMAGLTGAAVVVPQAMAYAAIAGLPLVVGLYTALVPLIVYAVMGTSRVLSVTTTSTIALLTAGALQRVDANGDQQLVLAAGTLAVVVGLVLLAAAVLRLGVIASFISEPVLVGFKAGVGIAIVVDQIPKLLGLHIVRGHFFHNVAAIVDHLPEVSWPTVLLAAVMLVLLTGLTHFARRARARAGAPLITVAAGIAASALFGVTQYGIELVGEVRGGLPRAEWPDWSMMEPLWPAAIGIALMSFVETTAAEQAFRRVGEPRPKGNRELLALGLTNLTGGLFQNMPSGGGTSQTAVNVQAGARTQMAGLMTAAVVAAVLLLLAPVVHLMPQATLAALVVVPCAGMIHLREFRAIRQDRFMEFSWAIISVAGVVVLGTLQGIVVAVVLSLLALVFHASRRPVFVLGRKRGTDVFRPRSKEHPDDEFFPGLLIVKTEGVLHFANARRIGDMIWHLLDEYQPKVVVMDCSAVPDLEYTAIKMITEAEKTLRDSGISLWLAAMNPEPLELVKKSALGKALGRERMFFNLDQAVESFQRRYGAAGQRGEEKRAGVLPLEHVE